MSGEAYAGDVSVDEAWEILGRDSRAVLVDVRTEPEWRFSGAPDLSVLGRPAVFAQWQLYPGGRNPDFVAEVEQNGVARDATVLLLCRSGKRSRDAAIALTGRGFARCYNVAHGFEGPPDEHGQRGHVAGWKAAGLPWRQE